MHVHAECTIKCANGRYVHRVMFNDAFIPVEFRNMEPYHHTCMTPAILSFGFSSNMRLMKNFF